MLDGWYCRSMANMQASEASGSAAAEHPQQRRGDEADDSSDLSSDGIPEHNYKTQYVLLKQRLKHLIFENESFQDTLRTNQRMLLKVSRDRTFLIDRLMHYEKPHDSSTSESEDTESSDDADGLENVARKKPEPSQSQNTSNAGPQNKPPHSAKRKRPATKKPNISQFKAAFASRLPPGRAFLSNVSDGHMTPEEVERHLQSRQSFLEMLPERAPPTVPTEMFSNDPSLDSESNDVMDNSPIVEEWYD